MLDFVFGKNIFLGVDIGASAIKIVELRLSGEKPVLSNYAWIDLGRWKNLEPLSAEEYNNFIAQCILKILHEAKIKGRNAYASLPSSGGLITIISVPQMSKDDMEEAIKFEAQKYIPTSLENVVFSWTVLSDGSNNSGNNLEVREDEEDLTTNSDVKIPVLLVAASRNKVSAYEDIINKAKLNLQSIEIESFPLVTSLIGNDKGNFIVLDIGSRICNIVLVEKGSVRASRNIDAGGMDITETIARNLGVNEERAEQLKTSGKDFFEGEYKVHFATLEAITSEINRIINIYLSKNPDFKLDSVILSGGSAKLTGLSNFLSKSLNQKVVIGNPFGRVSYDKKLDPIISQIGPQFSVALGLALEGVESYYNKKKDNNLKIKIKELYLASRRWLKKDLGKKST